MESEDVEMETEENNGNIMEANLFSEDEEEDGDEGDNHGQIADDEAIETPSRAEKPFKQKKIILNPQPKLNFERLQGPRGLRALNDMFKDIKYRGNGHEVEDLTQIMRRLEQWTFRLYPKFHFEDSLKRLESLGKKKIVHTYLRKIRLGIEDDDVVIHQFDGDEDQAPAEPEPDVGAPDDAFDELLSEQISPTQISQSSPPKTEVLNLTEDQQQRLLHNKKLAEEKRLARIKIRKELEDDTNENENTVSPSVID